jgi:hypothetical protein
MSAAVQTAWPNDSRPVGLLLMVEQVALLWFGEVGAGGSASANCQKIRRLIPETLPARRIANRWYVNRAVAEEWAAAADPASVMAHPQIVRTLRASGRLAGLDGDRVRVDEVEEPAPLLGRQARGAVPRRPLGASMRSSSRTGVRRDRAVQDGLLDDADDDRADCYRVLAAYPGAVRLPVLLVVRRACCSRVKNASTCATSHSLNRSSPGWGSTSLSSQCE